MPRRRSNAIFPTAALASLALACGVHAPPPPTPAEVPAAAPRDRKVEKAAPEASDGPATTEADLREPRTDSTEHWKSYMDVTLDGSDDEALRGELREGSPGNMGMVVAGGMLTAFGGLCGLAAPVFVVTDFAVGANGVLALIGGVPAFAATGLFLGIGLPLIYGGLKQDASYRSTSTTVPEVTIGPNGITSRWRF